VTAGGRICLQGKNINLSQVFAGQRVGVKEEDDKIWLVGFMNRDIGYFDLETCRVEPLDNPFGPKVLTMSPVQNVNHVSGEDVAGSSGQGRN
jgi:putative transposase